jgi:phospholipase D1/2
MAIQVRVSTRHCSVLPAGRNCRRIEEARRVSFHIDGDEYFSAFRAVAIRAQQSIMILRWDFDSRTGRVIDQKLEWLITDSRP